MKNSQPLLLLLGPILWASTMFAQSTNSSRANNLSETDSVAVARRSYIEADSESSPANNYAAGNHPAVERETWLNIPVHPVRPSVCRCNLRWAATLECGRNLTGDTVERSGH